MHRRSKPEWQSFIIWRKDFTNFFIYEAFKYVFSKTANIRDESGELVFRDLYIDFMDAYDNERQIWEFGEGDNFYNRVEYESALEFYVSNAIVKHNQSHQANARNS